MAETKDDKKPVTTSALDFPSLRSVALPIFISEVARRTPASQAAVMSYQNAAVFLAQEAELRRTGVIKQPVPRKRIRVMVQESDPVTGALMFEKTSGRPIVREKWGDPDSFAPNLPADHSQNQTYFRALEALGETVPKEYRRAIEDLDAKFTEYNIETQLEAKT